MAKLHHTALSVVDLERSTEWYAHFGLEQTTRYDAADGSLTIFHLRDQETGIELFWTPDMEKVSVTNESAGGIKQSGLKHICFQTADLEQEITRLDGVGIKPATEIENARSLNAKYIFFRDPDGNWVELMQIEA